jgi:hypothetical protein
VAFVFTREMIRAAEIERAFSPEVKMAQWREFYDRMQWEQRERLRRAFTTPMDELLRSIPPASSLARSVGLGYPSFRPAPRRKFRPSKPNFLYVLMREAYEKESLIRANFSELRLAEVRITPSPRSGEPNL